jgi:chromosome segregation ATPase
MDQIKKSLDFTIRNSNTYVERIKQLSADYQAVKAVNEALNTTLNQYKVQLNELREQYNKDISEINELFKTLVKL